MKKGKWIPLDKSLVSYLPKHRPYTILEAMFSYTHDKDNGKVGTIRGYTKLWQWNRRKVEKFIKTISEGNQYAPPHAPPNAPHVRFIFNKLESDLHHQLHHSLPTTIEPNNPIEPKEHNGFVQDTKLYEQPLSFNAFLQEVKINGYGESISVVERFIASYEHYRNAPHPPLRPATWIDVLDGINTCDAEESLCLEDHTCMIEHYFTKRHTKKIDFNICHYANPSILSHLYYDVVYNER